MRVLIHANVRIWSVDQPSLLRLDAHDTLADGTNELVIGTMTIWEISIKFGIGKLKLSQPFRPWMETAVADLDAALLSVSIATADIPASLPHHHNAPFDRMLIAQSQLEGVPIVSSDQPLDEFAIQRIW